MSQLSSEAVNINFLVGNFADHVPGVRDAIVVSADGLLMAKSGGLTRDAAEVHGHGRRRLGARGGAGVVDAFGHPRHGGLGRQRVDLGDRAHEGRLADGEPAGHDDLDRYRDLAVVRGRRTGAIREP